MLRLYLCQNPVQQLLESSPATIDSESSLGVLISCCSSANRDVTCDCQLRLKTADNHQLHYIPNVLRTTAQSAVQPCRVTIKAPMLERPENPSRSVTRQPLGAEMCCAKSRNSQRPNFCFLVDAASATFPRPLYKTHGVNIYQRWRGGRKRGRRWREPQPL